MRISIIPGQFLLRQTSNAGPVLLSQASCPQGSWLKTPGQIDVSCRKRRSLLLDELPKHQTILSMALKPRLQLPDTSMLA